MLAVLLACMVGAPRAASIEFAESWRAASQPIELAVGDTPQKLELTLPELAFAADRRVCLRFRVRLHAASPAGWTHCFAATLNGEDVGQLTAEHWPRLLNRASQLKTSEARALHTPYCRETTGYPAWIVLAGPSFEKLDARVTSDRGEGYWYLLDVTDLVRADGPNALTLVNTSTVAKWRGKCPADMRMVIDQLAIGCVPEREVRGIHAKYMQERREMPGTEIDSGPLQLAVTAAGGLQFRLAGKPCFLESAFSYPCGEERFNSLACRVNGPGGEPEWRPEIRRVAGAVELRSRGRYYQLVRRIRMDAGRIEIDDELSNLTDAPLGVRVQHRLIVPDLPATWRLAGVEGVPSFTQCVENPTVFAALKKGGLGIIARDNVFRAQVEARVDYNEVCFGTEHLGLKPKGSRVLRWAVYSGSSEYFDFINCLRRELGVNFTIEGPLDFTGAATYQSPESTQELQAKFERKAVKILPLTPWFVYLNSQFDEPWDTYKTQMQSAIQNIKSARPDAQCLAMLESNLTPVPLTFFKGSLPGDLASSTGKGRYGWITPPAARAIVDASPWRDSVLRDSAGNVLLDTQYAGHYAGRGLNLMVYPTLDNYWHGEMLRRIRFCLDVIGFDGIYFDQFSFAYSRRDRYTREFWDGSTVDIDPRTGQITQQYADLGMVTAPARRIWVEEVLKRGKVVVANSMPVANEMQTLPIFRFMEAEYSYDPTRAGAPGGTACARGHLASPIGLGFRSSRIPGGRERAGEILNRSVIANLEYGLVYYYFGGYLPPRGSGSGEYGPVNHMFPLTPVELHRGWVLGRERLITCLSGKYHWPGSEPPKIFLFDRVGREKSQKFPVRHAGDACEVEVTLDDWHEIAVLER